LIAPSFGEQFRVGDKVCVEGKNWNKVCGQVTRKKGSKAIAKMEGAVEGARTGDRVEVEGSKRAQVDEEVDGSGGSDWSERGSGLSSRGVKKKQGSVSEVSFLVHAGFTHPTFYSVNGGVDYNSFKLNAAIGLGFNIPIDEGDFSFEPSLVYFNKGAEKTESGNGSSLGISLKYLEVPLLFKARFSKDKFSPFFIGGPYFAYLLSAKLSSGVGLPGFGVVLPGSETDIKEYVRTFDLGFTAGLGFDLDLSSSSRVGFQFLASWGLINFEKEGAGLNGKNRQLALLGNLAFNL